MILSFPKLECRLFDIIRAYMHSVELNSTGIFNNVDVECYSNFCWVLLTAVFEWKIKRLTEASSHPLKPLFFCLQSLSRSLSNLRVNAFNVLILCAPRLRDMRAFLRCQLNIMNNVFITQREGRSEWERRVKARRMKT